jgi:hypothetical protein
LVTNADGVLEMKTVHSRHQVDSPIGLSAVRELPSVDFTEALNAAGLTTPACATDRRFGNDRACLAWNANRQIELADPVSE